MTEGKFWTFMLAWAVILKNFELGEVMEESVVKKVTESYLDLMLLINPVI